MELLNIQIQGYKSIEKLNFPIESLNGSYTKILIGKNETGKSNILQAMALLNDFNNDKNVDFLKLQNKTTEQKYAEVYYTMKPETNNCRTTIKEHLDINEEILNEITVRLYLHQLTSQTFILKKPTDRKQKLFLKATY